MLSIHSRSHILREETKQSRDPNQPSLTCSPHSANKTRSAGSPDNCILSPLGAPRPRKHFCTLPCRIDDHNLIVLEIARRMIFKPFHRPYLLLEPWKLSQMHFMCAVSPCWMTRRQGHEDWVRVEDICHWIFVVVDTEGDRCALPRLVPYLLLGELFIRTNRSYFDL